MERLDATNTILIVLAVASVLQTLVVLAAAYGAFRAYHDTAARLDAKLMPLLVRLDRVLTNLEHTSAVVRTRTDDMNRAINTVGSTATRLGAVMGRRAAVALGVASGVLGVVRRWRAARRARADVTVVAG
jgi:hypothetical protein